MSSSGGSPPPMAVKKKSKNKKPAAHMQASSFKGKVEDLKSHVYDVAASGKGHDMFIKTTREIAAYIGREIKGGGEFRTALDPETLAFTTLTAPTRPAPVFAATPAVAADPARGSTPEAPRKVRSWV